MLHLSSLFLFVLFFILRSKNNVIDEIGQDLILVIYPVFIYFIIRGLDFSKNYLTYYWRYITNIYSVIYIVDFLVERLGLFKKIFWIDVYFADSKAFDLINLKITEMSGFILIGLFLLYRSKKFQSWDFLLPFCFLTLASSQSRTVLVGTIVFLLLTIKSFKKEMVKKYFIFALFGALLSFSFVMDLTEANLKNFAEMNLLIQTNSQNTTGEELTFRSNEPECLFDSFFGNKRINSCEIFISDIFLISKITKEDSTEKELYNLQIDFDQFNDDYNNLILAYNSLDEYGGLDVVINKIEGCGEIKYLLPNANIDSNCHPEEIKVLSTFLSNKQTFYSNNVCLSTIEWRTTLWREVIESQKSNLANVLYGIGVGIEIPKNNINKDSIKYPCYKDVIESERPLRNAHNTFLTFINRFGLISVFLFSLLIKKFLTGKIFFNLSNIIIPIACMTFLEPILDSPIFGIPFWIFVFSYIKFINVK